MSYIFITRPKFDETTSYLYAWSSLIIDEFKKSNFKVIDLKKSKVNRKNVEKVLKKMKEKISFIIFNGHGTPTEICGHNNEPLINTKNKDLLKSKIVYSISCNSGKKLGKEIADENTSFLGYREEFLFVIDKNKSCTPEKDEIARPFMECSNQISISLLKGKTVKEAYHDTVERYNRWIIYYSCREYLPESSVILSCLLWNRNSLVLHGKEDKRLG